MYLGQGKNSSAKKKKNVQKKKKNVFKKEMRRKEVQRADEQRFICLNVSVEAAHRQNKPPRSELLPDC